jgi:hypothetical protein
MTLSARLYYLRHPRRSRRHLRAVRAPWPPLDLEPTPQQLPPGFARPIFPETPETLRILAREEQERTAR